MRLSETRVVLTGASGGIGLAITTALCASPVWLSTPMCSFIPKKDRKSVV